MARFNHNTKKGAFQSTITVVREVDASDETPQEVQGIQGQTASLSLATGISDKMRNSLRSSKLSLDKSKFLNPRVERVNSNTYNCKEQIL